MEKTTGIKLPTPFPKTLEIEGTDSHIPSAPAAAAKLTQIQNPKGPSPLRLTIAPFRLIFGLEKTPKLAGAAKYRQVIISIIIIFINRIETWLAPLNRWVGD
jgi:hypothetical protein